MVPFMLAPVAESTPLVLTEKLPEDVDICVAVKDPVIVSPPVKGALRTCVVPSEA